MEVGTCIKQRADQPAAYNECLLKAFLNIGKFDEAKGSLSTWIRKLSRNTCIDIIRSKKRKSQIEYLFIEESDNSILNSAEEEKDPSEDLGEQILNLMQKLKPREIEIIMLKYFDNHNFEYVAGKLNIGEANARAIAFRAKEKLKEFVLQEPVFCKN